MIQLPSLLLSISIYIEREREGSWLVGGVDVKNQKENRWYG